MTAVQHANGRAPAAKTAPARRPDVRSNGDYANSAAWGNVYDAATQEEGIRAEAEAIWTEHGIPAMTRTLFMRLYPLLRRPIHPGHIIATSKAKGKPYESDGVRSAQVLIDRMNNVLTPSWWRVTRQYEEDGKLCFVAVRVFDEEGNVLAEGESYGGMNRANTLGNLRKASFTNAAKLAFAAVGPGHEIYCQAIDYDPDLLPGAIEDQAAASAVAHAQRPQPTAAPATPAAPPEPDPGDVIDTLLMLADDLAPLRKQAVDGLKQLGAKDPQIARELRAASDGGKRDLEALITRVGNAFDARAETS